MKKIITTLLAMALLLQMFTFTALAADLSIEIELDTVAKEVIVKMQGLESNSQYSIRGFYNETLDYLNQFKADEDGTATYKYPSSQESWEAGATITVWINNKDTSAKVPGGDDPILATSITIEGGTLVSVKAGSVLDLTAIVAPDDATVKTVNWASTNPSTATVVNGKVTAIKPGTVLISATTTDGTNLTYSIMVRVIAS